MVQQLLESVKTVLKKKTDLMELKTILARNGELVNHETSETKAESRFGQALLDAGLRVLPQFKVGDYTFDFKKSSKDVHFESYKMGVESQ